MKEPRRERPWHIVVRREGPADARRDAEASVVGARNQLRRYGHLGSTVNEHVRLGGERCEGEHVRQHAVVRAEALEDQK
jgi:hypothetical protein